MSIFSSALNQSEVTALPQAVESNICFNHGNSAKTHTTDADQFASTS